VPVSLEVHRKDYWHQRSFPCVGYSVDRPCHYPLSPPCPLPCPQALRDTESLLRGDEACVALLSEARRKQSQHGGLLRDARPATARTYIYTQKTEEDGLTRHTFCYSLESGRWREASLGPDPQGGRPLVPDPPGSHLIGYAEKVSAAARHTAGVGRVLWYAVAPDKETTKWNIQSKKHPCMHCLCHA